jgi:hypothetical protein
MTRIKLLFPVAIICLFLISCAKEKSVDSSTQTPGGPGSGSNALLGTWKLIKMNMHTRAVVEMNDAGIAVKTITYSGYDTKDNQGTLKFTSNKAENINWSYSVDDFAYGYFYENNVLVDSLQFPLVVVTPTSNTNTTYRLIGADSIYYEAGGTVTVGGQTTTSGAGGARYKIENDILTMTTYYSSQTSGSNQGVPYTQTNSAKSVATLQRQ